MSIPENPGSGPNESDESAVGVLEMLAAATNGYDAHEILVGLSDEEYESLHEFLDEGIGIAESYIVENGGSTNG